jgi:hypothetical protein
MASEASIRRKTKKVRILQQICTYLSSKCVILTNLCGRMKNLSISMREANSRSSKLYEKRTEK